MVYTNVYNLPKSFYRAIVKNTYDLDQLDENIISATTLIAPIRQAILKVRHWKEITEDISDAVWRLFGEAIHYVVTKANDDKSVVEKRLKYEFDNVTLSGKPDIYIPEEKTIEDYKITSVWSAIFGDHVEWEQQLNIYAWLHRQQGDEIEKLRIIAILKDWQRKKALTDNNYPETPIQVIDIPLWSEEKQEKFIRGRLGRILEARKLPDDKLPLCTAEERWKTDDVWKIKKPKRKTAVRVFKSRKEADEYIDKSPEKKLSVEFVKGEDRRCLEYCPVNRWCSYYKEVYGDA